VTTGGFELIGGREKRAIVLVPSDPRWPLRFARERERIVAALGGAARLVEHIGSTSVPGLIAKPIVDVLVGVDDPDDERLVDALVAAGYELRVREPGHRMVRKPEHAGFAPGESGVHVHVWRHDDVEVERYLRFRDRLRADAGERAAYAALKQRLAALEWDDMNDYAEAKSSLVEEILARAGAPPRDR
jgi:GrpB-like predicted nucleotidyltransferase (UPF0157 family)